MLVSGITWRIWRYRAAIVLVAVSLFLLTGCGSGKLVDQSDRQMGAIADSIQPSFAEEGWEYTGYEVTGTDEANDSVSVVLSYDVEENAADQLKENTSTKPKNDRAYDLAEDVNVKVTVTLSGYNKESDTIGSYVGSTEWFVGETEANEWLRGQE